MKCEVCTVGTRREQLIRYQFSSGDQVVIVEGVPAAVCDHCGETSIAPGVATKLQKTVWERKEPLRKMEAAVYEFSS